MSGVSKSSPRKMTQWDLISASTAFKEKIKWIYSSIKPSLGLILFIVLVFEVLENIKRIGIPFHRLWREVLSKICIKNEQNNKNNSNFSIKKKLKMNIHIIYKIGNYLRLFVQRVRYKNAWSLDCTWEILNLEFYRLTFFHF